MFGVGDFYVFVFIYGFVSGWDIEMVLKYGSVFVFIVVSKYSFLEVMLAVDEIIELIEVQYSLNGKQNDKRWDCLWVR